jgi:SWI/SNF-related matrix-associated actin-dependent regulator of chromatin subfamily B protein 1
LTLFHRPKRPDPTLADKADLLVPIRLDIDVLDGHNRLREAFIWNANGRMIRFASTNVPDPIQITDPFVTPNAFAQTLCDDFGIAQVNHAKVINSVVSSIAEQITDFKNHHVEVDHSLHPPARPAKPTQLTDSRPEIVVTEPGSDAQNKQVIKIVEGIDRKRVPTVSGWLDEEETEWWERWRRHIAQLDERITSASLGTKKKGKKRRKENAQPLGVTNGEVKMEAIDFPGVPPPAEIKNEFAEQVLVVDYDEEEKDDGSVNEDLRVVIKVAIFQIVCSTCEVLTLAH